MKRHFLIMATVLSITIGLITGSARAQDEASFKFGFFGGLSNPTGNYKEGIGRATGGKLMGISADYMFVGSKLGIGLDARLFQHPHQRPDTVVEQANLTTSTTLNTYTSPLRFKHYSFTLGPVYRIGEGKLIVDLYAKGGMIFERFPTYLRKETVVIEAPLSNGPPGTFVFEKAAAKTEQTSSLTMMMGARLSFEVLPNIELFVFGDYQSSIGSKGKFVVEDLQNPQDTQQTPIRMFSYGGGLRLAFGAGRDDSSLSRSY